VYPIGQHFCHNWKAHNRTSRKPRAGQNRNCECCRPDTSHAHQISYVQVGMPQQV